MIKGVISVGSNYCHLAKEYKEWIGRGAENFLLFEPVKETYDRLLEEIFYRLPADIDFRTDTRRLALGNQTGKVWMNIEKDNKGQSSSILKPKLHLEQYKWIKFTDKEEVDIDRLDNVDYDRELYDFLHIDVQGYELEVLMGAVESLRYIDEIECEVNTEELYEGCPMLEDIDRFMYENNFSRTNLKMLASNWGDATYKRANYGSVTKF